MVWFIILAVLTAGLALGLPPDPQTLHKLHISSLMYHVAILVLLVPYGIIWYAAFYAFAKLKEYSRTIKGFDDGKAFRNIMIGVGVLAFGLIVPTAISLILQNIASHHHAFKPTSVIIDNYLNISAALISFIYINNGAHSLIKLSKTCPGLTGIRVFALLFTALAVTFTYLVMRYRTAHNIYHLNTPLLITTFIIPSLFAWFTALASAYELGWYAKFANGLLYRQALRQFAYGITATIGGVVLNQFVDNTFAEKVSNSLGSLLLADYTILVIVAWGLILMALGAQKLKKIEEA